VTEVSRWQGICPDCKSGIGELIWPAKVKTCPQCSVSILVPQGIYRLINNQQLLQYDRFLNDYTMIRHAEGRGSHSVDYYMRLPESDKSDPLAWQWRIRNTSYQWFLSEILSNVNSPLRIVDLGAGVGWLSHKLAEQKHHPVAIDLSVDSLDGLSASTHYGGTWPRIQAEFDHLPLADNQADMIIYNASLHYSTDYHTTFQEALRILRNDGRIVIMDTPIYQKEASGEQMKTEKHDQFERQFGIRSDSVNSIEYMTWDRLNQLGSELGLKWHIVKPWYGWRWALRPLAARIKGKRKPSCFAIITGTRKT